MRAKTYVDEHEVRRTAVLARARLYLRTEGARARSSIGRVRVVLVRDRVAEQYFVLQHPLALHDIRAEYTYQEVVDQVHLRGRVALRAVDLTVKSGICHVIRGLPDVGKF